MEQGAGLLSWLHASSVAGAMRSSTWMYPVVEIVHIVGFSVLVGAVAMFDLRVLGCARALPVDGLARILLPWSLASLVLIVPAGLLMFAAQPLALAASGVFQLKLLLIGLAGANAACFHLGVYRSVAAWNTRSRAPALAQVQSAFSLLLWVAVISCGRLLAYL